MPGRCPGLAYFAPLGLPRQNQGDGETHPEQARVSAGLTGRGGEDRAGAGGAALCGVGVKARLRREWRVSSERGKREARRGIDDF